MSFSVLTLLASPPFNNTEFFRCCAVSSLRRFLLVVSAMCGPRSRAKRALEASRRTTRKAERMEEEVRRRVKDEKSKKEGRRNDERGKEGRKTRRKGVERGKKGEKNA